MARLKIIFQNSALSALYIAYKSPMVKLFGWYTVATRDLTLSTSSLPVVKVKSEKVKSEDKKVL